MDKDSSLWYAMLILPNCALLSIVLVGKELGCILLGMSILIPLLIIWVRWEQEETNNSWENQVKNKTPR